MGYKKRPLTEEIKMDLLSLVLENPMRLADEVLCDFCGGRCPIYIYAAHRMSTGWEINCWRWCACKRCSKLVDANDWVPMKGLVREKLTKSFYRSVGVPMPSDLLAAAIDTTFESFLADAVVE